MQFAYISCNLSKIVRLEMKAEKSQNQIKIELNLLRNFSLIPFNLKYSTYLNHYSPKFVNSFAFFTRSSVSKLAR